MKIYEFEKHGITLDATTGTLSTPGGDMIELRPQSREVLMLLAATPNQTITKTDFSEQVWDGRNVSDDSLVQCIAEIRAALGDNDRKIIQTVPRKGYRFAPPGGPVSDGATPHRRHIVLAAAIAVVVLVATALVFNDVSPDRPAVVAVLPLDDLSSAPHQGYLSDALAEGIISELARFPQFRTVARNSSFQFRNTPTDVRKIGAILGAGYVVEGSQQFDGDRLRVTIQLVETDTGAHLFSDKYDRAITDLFAVQDDIVRQIASLVGQVVLTDMPQRASASDVDSRLRGLQARKIMTQLTYENWQKALAIEETSIRLEPDSAWGYIGKSLMLGVAARLGWLEPRDEVLAEATELAESALRRAPENYMSHFALARVLSRTYDHAESILHFQRAAELNPSDSLILIGLSVPLLYSGRTDEAIAALKKAAAVDPLHGDWLRWQLGWAYWQNNECDKGLEAMQSMSSPNIAANKTLASILICLGREDEARETLARYLDARPGFTLEIEARDVPDNWKPDGMAERWMDDMRSAGMPSD